MEYTQIVVENRGAIEIITLNRPDHLNAYTWRMELELRQALREVERDNNKRISIITGAGKAFCAGADMSENREEVFNLSQNPSGEQKELMEMGIIEFAFNLKKPVITAFNGAAVGVGLTLPLSFDLRIASQEAKFGFVFTRRGIVPEAGSPWLLTRMIGLPKTIELLYTGRVLNAQEALEYGIISRVVPGTELMEAAVQVASDIIERTSSLSVALTKELIYYNLFENDIRRIEQINNHYLDWIGKQADVKEGVTAFFEKRKPQWPLAVPQDLPPFNLINYLLKSDKHGLPFN